MRKYHEILIAAYKDNGFATNHNKGAITMDQSHFNTIEDARKSGRHLSLEGRGMIQALHRQGLSLRGIAAEVGCAHTTVFYELRRGTPMRKSNRGRVPWY